MSQDGAICSSYGISFHDELSPRGIQVPLLSVDFSAKEHPPPGLGRAEQELRM